MKLTSRELNSAQLVKARSVSKRAELQLEFLVRLVNSIPNKGVAGFHTRNRNPDCFLFSEKAKKRGKQRHKTTVNCLSKSLHFTVVSFQFSSLHQTSVHPNMPSEDSKPVKKEVEENDEKPNNGKNNPKSNEEAKAKKEPVNDNDGGSEKPTGKKKPNSANTPKVKKEESKKKPNNATTPKSGSTKKTQAKKEEDYDSDDEKPISKKKPNDVDKKKNKVKKEEEEKKIWGKEAENGKKREKKVYDLLGQKRDPPEERDPLRIFYKTLYEQMPGSEMAAFWLMECGLLPEEVAKKVFEKKQKKNPLQKLGSPMKTVVTVNKTSKSVTSKKETLSSPVSSQKKKKTPDSKVASKQTKKRKIEDGSCSEDGSDDDFVLSTKVAKRQKVA
ncbi:uncharacterized protein LOC131333016 [Rhododendron vialii]|uniref:uncharacterized protein LOC131333016 n=1 Tax=Rhododendron vialii TaxID=182163 RepID=UPI00265E692C|nr:uncharacterized protein LOC131333016 [Rhododendron vialii]